MTRLFLLLFLASISFFTACKNETSINQDDASDVITANIESNPEYKTTAFKFGELRFHSRKDREELNKYKELEEKGLIEMEVDEMSKRTRPFPRL